MSKINSVIYVAKKTSNYVLKHGGAIAEMCLSGDKVKPILKVAGGIAAGIGVGRAYQHHKDKKNEYYKASEYHEVINDLAEMEEELRAKFEEYRREHP